MNIFPDPVNAASFRPAIVRPDQPPTELELDHFLYARYDASTFMNPAGWVPYFDSIPVDPYISEGYRHKSIAWFRIKHGQTTAIPGIDAHISDVNDLSGMSKEENERYISTAAPDWTSRETGYSCWNLPAYALQQSIKYNPVHGDMRREYPRISGQVINSLDFQTMLLNYACFFGWSDAIVLVQFQRVDCNIDRAGLAAVEGFHQDGNRHVGMLVVNRDNITDTSGVSQYVMDEQGRKTDALVLDAIIAPGELIYWNDKRLWHYGTELQVADPGENQGRGLRDIVLMSAKTPPANMPMGPIPGDLRI